MTMNTSPTLTRSASATPLTYQAGAPTSTTNMNNPVPSYIPSGARATLPPQQPTTSNPTMNMAFTHTHPSTLTSASVHPLPQQPPTSTPSPNMNTTTSFHHTNATPPSHQRPVPITRHAPPYWPAAGETSTMNETPTPTPTPNASHPSSLNAASSPPPQAHLSPRATPSTSSQIRATIRTVYWKIDDLSLTPHLPHRTNHTLIACNFFSSRLEFMEARWEIISARSRIPSSGEGEGEGERDVGNRNGGRDNKGDGDVEGGGVRDSGVAEEEKLLGHLKSLEDDIDAWVRSHREEVKEERRDYVIQAPGYDDIVAANPVDEVVQELEELPGYQTVVENNSIVTGIGMDERAHPCVVSRVSEWVEGLSGFEVVGGYMVLDRVADPSPPTLKKRQPVLGKLVEKVRRLLGRGK